MKNALIQGTVENKGHYRNFYRPNGVEFWIAFRFYAPLHERRAEFDTQQEAIDWLNQNPHTSNSAE